MNAQFHNYTASLYFKRRDSKTDDGDRRAISGISSCLCREGNMIRGEFVLTLDQTLLKLGKSLKIPVIL